MHLSLFSFEIICLISLIAGFLSAICGSTGIIMLPALLFIGLPPHMALGTNKLYTSASLFTSASYFLKKGFLKPKLWLLTTLAAIIGAISGVLLTQLVSNERLAQVLPIVIAAVAIYFLIPKRITKKSNCSAALEKDSHKSVALSSLLGVYSGFLGAGTGAIWTASANAWFKMDILRASALSRYMCFVTNSVALVVFLLLNQVNIKLGIACAIFGSLGAILGSKVAVRGNGELIRKLLIGTTLLMSMNLAFDNWF